MNHRNQNQEDEMNNLVFTEETEKDPAKLELWQTNANTLRITMEPAEDDDYMRFMSIELDRADAHALANEMIRIVKAMDADAMRTHATASITQKQKSTIIPEKNNGDEPPEDNAIPEWRLREKQQQLKLITA